MFQMNTFLILYEIQLENSTVIPFQQAKSSTENPMLGYNLKFQCFSTIFASQSYWSQVFLCEAIFQPRHLQPFPKMFIVSLLGMVETTRLLQSVMSFPLDILPVDVPVNKHQQHRLWQQLPAVSSLIQCFLFPLLTGIFGNNSSKKISLLPMIFWQLASS